ncbi:hypothetical protein GCM10010304_44400 [Streptomyces roseoviolaceus]
MSRPAETGGRPAGAGPTVARMEIAACGAQDIEVRLARERGVVDSDGVPHDPADPCTFRVKAL